MQIPFNTISISCAYLLVLFCFIINNKVYARALTRDAPNAALEHKRYQHSALRKRSLHLKSNDHDEDARQYERAVKAVLDYAQYKLQQSKRHDDTPKWTETITDPGEAPAGSTNDNAANMWTEEATGVAENTHDGGQGLLDNPNAQWTETVHRRNKQTRDEDPSNMWNEVGTGEA